MNNEIVTIDGYNYLVSKDPTTKEYNRNNDFLEKLDMLIQEKNLSVNDVVNSFCRYLWVINKNANVSNEKLIAIVSSILTQYENHFGNPKEEK